VPWQSVERSSAELKQETVEAPEPVFYRLHLADRKTMTSCVLFGLNPLLALTPPDMVQYLPLEIREALDEAPKRNVAAGATIGAGAGAGIGACVAARSEPFSLEQIRDWAQNNVSDALIVDQIQATHTIYQLTPEQILWLHESGVTDAVIRAMTKTTVEEMTRQAASRAAAMPPASACPYVRQVRAAPTPSTLEPERTVLDNLKALEESRHLFDEGKEYLRTGRVCEALDFFERIGSLCPGSRYEEMAQALVAEVMKRFPGGGEEAEEGAKQSEDSGPQSKATPAAMSKEQEITNHLAMAVTVRFQNEPLKEVIEDFRHAYGLDIVIDEKALADKGISTDRPVTIKLEQVCLKSVLTLMLRNFGLAYVIENDAIVITTPEVAERDLEPGARIMADGLLKAGNLALDAGRYAQAVDFARQAFALDPWRMRYDESVRSLFSFYLLSEKPTSTPTVRINNIETPVVSEPSLRPNLPGVDPRVVAAMDKVLAEAETKRPRLKLTVEEEQEAHAPVQSIEIEEPFLLDSAVTMTRCQKEFMAAYKTWRWLGDVVPAVDCAEVVNDVLDFRFNVILTAQEDGKTWTISYGLLGWSVEEVPTIE
jgi:tetratricopeptide (TPR) repeat protein